MPEEHSMFAHRGRRIWQEFREFSLRGNMVELAIGVVIGTAFNAVINSLVKDIILPPFGFLLNNVNFSNLYINLSGSSYSSLAQAQAAGAITINYGLFINALINFAVIAISIFIVVKQFNRFHRHEEEHKQTEKKCPFCQSDISVLATRCPHCTSTLN